LGESIFNEYTFILAIRQSIQERAAGGIDPARIPTQAPRRYRRATDDPAARRTLFSKRYALLLRFDSVGIARPSSSRSVFELAGALAARPAAVRDLPLLLLVLAAGAPLAG